MCILSNIYIFFLLLLKRERLDFLCGCFVDIFKADLKTHLFTTCCVIDCLFQVLVPYLLLLLILYILYILISVCSICLIM